MCVIVTSNRGLKFDTCCVCVILEFVDLYTHSYGSLLYIRKNRVSEPFASLPSAKKVHSSLDSKLLLFFYKKLHFFFLSVVV